MRMSDKLTSNSNIFPALAKVLFYNVTIT